MENGGRIIMGEWKEENKKSKEKRRKVMEE